MELNQREEEEEKQRDVWMERERESSGGTSLRLLVSRRPRARLAPSGSASSLSERSGGAVPGSDRWLRSLSLLFWVNCGVIVDAVCSGTATRGNGGAKVRHMPLDRECCQRWTHPCGGGHCANRG